MFWMLKQLGNRIVRTGNLIVTDSRGDRHRFGNGDGKPIHIALRTTRAERSILLNPANAVPEAYMNGELDIVEGDLLDFIHFAYANLDLVEAHTPLMRAAEKGRLLAKPLHQWNPVSRSRANVQHHYDLSEELYRLFLDEDMQYSCAYFERPDLTLDEAQKAKKRHIAAKLALKPGLSILDIGSGWGGLGIYLAQHFEADVLGVTLSDEQHRVATERAHALGFDRHVHFEIRDYRSLQERFDRIVSVGMFEHVGVNHYRTFFETCAKLLKPDGVMVLHSIGRAGPPAATAPFIRKHIFPGGYIPALSEVLPAIERSGLMVTDVEILRLHYAETLRHWRERFAANRERAKALYDERFCRMWEFYLAASEGAFRWQDLMVFQIQLTRRNDTLPITRDYIHEVEMQLADKPEPRKARTPRKHKKA
ncbi:methyltransferase domain-containing protein [Aliihoeflea aestuarii]|jgi:cyclopropane-fatty-acyl-phospholipid synthase|uniref:SAM-dependent methyltransferase n=1 Tax=Aliihoeflea aestuarii TaxID=453840 RepID=UPI002094E889|nr:cyclopropane-fatty-acyl-phospholipid synthase family protein [Aliihoeflea aestuarii]MCO6392778.1 methyltransferase domain-containing protein [Aliihoeflea aestuarii]